MAKMKDPNREKAKELYDKHNGQITNREIANLLDEDEKKIAVWKQRDNWNNVKKNNVVQQKEKCYTTNKNSITKEAANEVIKDVMRNTELSAEHKMFCVIYAKRQNATKAYQKVYHCTYETAMVEGCRLLRNPKIREQIDKLLEAELNKEFLKKGLIQQYKDIAFSDIGDYLEFGKKSVLQWKTDKEGNRTPLIDPDTGEQLIKEYSYVELKDSVCVDTSLITEVSEGKDGIKFKLADKMKAMEVLAKLSNLLSDEEKTQLDIENKKLQNAKIKAETSKITGEDEEVITNDGFIEALNGTAQEDWEDEKEDN